MSSANQATDPDGLIRQCRPLELALAGAAAASALAICAPALRLLPSIWGRSEFYAHGYAIPAVAAFLIYRNRRKINGALRNLRPPAKGPFVALGAGLFEVLMIVGDLGFPAGLGISVVLVATAYAIGGLPLLRPCLLPVGFLALMVPPPRFLIYEILFRLKLFVTHLAVSLLQASGQTVAVQGNQILLPGHTLFVTNACSGLISIITLFPLACIVAYFLSHGVWRRVAIIASVVPLAVGANILRIIWTVQLVSNRGIEYAQGLLHEGFGLATYVIGTLALLGVAKALR